MTSEADLSELMDFISGTGKFSLFGAGMHTHPNSDDPSEQRKYEMCLELEKQGKIRRHLVTDTAIVWMPMLESFSTPKGVE